ncbi:HTTM,Vitamin K-dependent gamma-carboxylase [Cinara cedri]|uniref:HTTM,Vitamin K-dependent gamma-carboxylase n=1 Tax=Cinara cedri TaxID=506608 RepID=A0A5E4ME00_9HEMI|nr:HTTM,Vitamin K-dependent gamma-carboxylase [Cinara cedri]
MDENSATTTAVTNTENVAADRQSRNKLAVGIGAAWHRLVTYMFEPEDGTCLAMMRIAFATLMIIDTMNERGFCRVDKRWMEPMKCYFPLFDIIKPLPGGWMCLVYAVMFSGLLGVFAGFYYRTSCIAYAVTYWYIFLADKSSWNNHSYLFGLLTLIFSVTDAHRNWSVNSWSEPQKPVPRWNYLLLRIQFFIMYFVAGLKKFEPDWLWGYSMMTLGHNYAFTPFRYVFSAEFVDHWIVHVGGFLIDLLSGFGLCFRSSRPFTIVVLLIFHGMNSAMFSIGMFPYVCAAMLPVFCEPAAVARALGATAVTGTGQSGRSSDAAAVRKSPTTAAKRNAVAACVCAYAVLQLFMPYSHFVTRGYNGFRDGLYGYSWDMMLYNVDLAKIQVKVVDHKRREKFFVDPESWTDNSKWVLHGDMMRQFARCVAANMPDRRDNMSVLMDVWGSLNGRFHQRLVDPNVDLLHAPWSPWSPVPWLMPAIRHLDRWRPWIVDAKNRTDDHRLLFFADFQGMTLTHDDLPTDKNVTAVRTATLAVIEGAVAVRNLGAGGGGDGSEVRVVSGEAMDVTGRYAVTTVSATPSCYVYAETAAAGDDGENDAAERSTGGGRPKCSTACFAFALDAAKYAFSPFFP